MRNPLEARRASFRSPPAVAGYDPARRVACKALLAGPVRSGAARRLVELVLTPREHREELAEIFDQVEELDRAPTLAGLIAVAARATAAHTCRGARSLGGSVVAISAEVDRRFSACESGEAGYPLSLTGLGAAGHYGLENRFSPVYLTHTLELIVESALFGATVIEPSCAPGAYVVRCEPQRSTTAEVRSLLVGHLARHQNATIDFALEELTSRYRRDPVAVDHLQYLILALRAPVDVQQLVVQGHALLSAACDDVDIDAELAAAARILDGSGLTTDGSLSLGGAVGAITSLAAELVSALHGARTGHAALAVEPAPSGYGQRPPAGQRSPAGRHCDAADLARSVLRAGLVVAWCARHGRIRPGVIGLDETVELGC
jgi:hypothetical protein